MTCMHVVFNTKYVNGGMRAARELAKKADQQRKAKEAPSGEEKSPSKEEKEPETKDKKRSADEIRGQRAAGKKGETREQQRRRVKRRWQRGLHLSIAGRRKWQLDDLKNFRYATKLPPKNDKGRAKFGSAKKIQELEDKLELVQLREEQLEFVKKENLRLQFRIGIALTSAGDYLEAFNYLERVCKLEGAYQESEEEKRKRLKIEFDIAKERGKLQLQLEFEAEQAAASKKAKKSDGADGETKSPEKEKLKPKKKEEEKAWKGDNDDEEEEPRNPDYASHMWAARCCVGLFKKTKMHYHLNAAYGHYLRSIECMTVPNDKFDMSTTLRLPVIYFELGELFELFGSYESALNIYSRSMNEFPHSRNYFDIMYRSCLVGRHLMEITTNEKGKEDMLNRCIDMLQFLLEALPEHIDEANIIFLYARTLEQSQDPAVRYRSLSAFDSLFICMNSHKIANAQNFGSFKLWTEEPDNWLKFAAYIKDFGEEFLSKDAHETYMSKMNSRRGPGKPLEHYVETDILLELAETYANHQNYRDATRYAEMALNKNRLDKRVRNVLSQYSKVHKEKLEKEVNSINTLHRRWSERAWTDKSRKKLKEMEMDRLLKKYHKNIYDREARRLLAYYDRETWRSKFMFEISCVVRVQRFIRNKFVCWKVQSKFRDKYLSRASRAYTMYNRKPFDEENRKEIRKICASRFCPRKHIIRKLRAVLDSQDQAAVVMTRNSKSYLSRVHVYDGIARTKARREEYRQLSTWKLQQMVRGFLARRKILRVMEDWARKAVAAVVVQRFWRWREKTFQHAVTKIVVMQRKSRARAFMTFQVILKYHLVRRLRTRRGEKEKKSAARLAIEEKMRRERVRRARNQGATVIQRFFASSRDNFLSRNCSQAVRARRQARFSHSISGTVAQAESGEVGYIRPGFRQSGPQFGAALAQREVICMSPFDSADGVMLAALLRHNSCRIRTLVFQGITDGSSIGMEDHILPALQRCSSIRRIAILGGCNFPVSVFEALYKLVQVDNPRIVHLHIERANHSESDHVPMKRFVSSLVQLNATLLMDYFNYCLPGLRTLSLHGCYLRDEDAAVLMDGLRVNSSLRRLSLSLNILTDTTLVALLGAVTEDAHRSSSLEHVELGYNLISSGREATAVIEQVMFSWLPAEKERRLCLHLEGNPIPLSKERYLCGLEEGLSPDVKGGLRIGATTRVHDPKSAHFEIGDEASVMTRTSQSQASI